MAYYKTGNTSPTIIIVSPLNAISNEQLERYGENAIQVTPEYFKTLSDHKCSDKCDLSCSVKRFRTADFKFILGHPEHFMEKVVFNNFLTPVWQDTVKYIVIDEAHCIDKWGDSFRKEFRNLGRLRSLFPMAKTLTLTCTATGVTVMNIKKSLNLNNPKIAKTSVIRNNIKIEVERKPKDSRGSQAVYEKVMSRTFNDFENENINYPKTIIYSQLKFCGLGYSLVERNGAHELADGTRIAAQYHSPCTDKVIYYHNFSLKKEILNIYI